MSLKYKLTLCYDGANYCGWQNQPNGASIQGVIERALAKIVQRPCPIIGASRTDAGVHAKEQVAHFTIEKAIAPIYLKKSINALLPPEIRALALEESPSDFHARYSAIGKRYTYRVVTNPIMDPFLRSYALHYTYPLDYALIEKTANLCCGTKDFRGFTNEGNSTYAEKSSIKTLHKLTLCKTDFGFDLLFHGNSFLYKMVRNLTGTLLEIGRGKMPPSQINKIFATKDRRLAGPAAPAHALTLKKVFYN